MYLHIIFTLNVLFCEFYVLGDKLNDEVSSMKSINDSIQNYEHLDGMIAKKDLYINAVTQLETKWDTQDTTDLDKTRVKYSVEILKRIEFTRSFHCSQWSLALICTKFLMEKMELFKTATTDKNLYMTQMVKVSSLINSSIFKMMAILSSLDFEPTKWMVVLSLFTFDVQRKSGNEKKLEQAIQNYLVDSCKKILTILDHYKDTCGESEDNDVVLAYEEILKKLEDLNKSVINFQIPPTSPVLECYDFKQWFLTDLVLNDDNFKIFTANDSKVSMGIRWSTLQGSLKIKLISQDYKAVNTNWMSKFLEAQVHSQDSVQTIMKQVYRTVVIRNLLATVTHCDNMYYQITHEINPKDINIEDIGTTVKKMCGPIVGAVTMAIEHLGGDDFLEDMLPLIKTYVEQGVRETSTIIVKSMEQLDSLSARLNTNVNIYIPPMYEDKDIIKHTKDKIFRETKFEWLKMAVKEAVEYPKIVKDKFPFINFIVINNIQKSVG